ncbi:MAG: hypothetical protein R2828_05745 [Saprospiraceae bacterium]
MKKIALVILCSLSGFVLPGEGFAMFIHPVKAPLEVDAKTQKKMEKADRKALKMEKRLGKLEEKLEKKGILVKQEVWEDTRFRYGVLLLAAAIVLGILSALLAGVGVINFIAGIFALGGVILLLWSLIEYYG